MENLECYVGELRDRQKIWDALICYTRGVDRLDRELMLRAFHADALIDQGTFKGSREGLADWVLSYHQDNQRLTQHLMTNHYCEIEGSEAHTETHVVYYGTNPEGAPEGTDAFAVGRYIDRLECRDGVWAIAARVCTTEGTTDFSKNGLLAKLVIPEDSLAKPSRDRSDPSYLRPLLIPDS